MCSLDTTQCVVHSLCKCVVSMVHQSSAISAVFSSHSPTGSSKPSFNTTVQTHTLCAHKRERCTNTAVHTTTLSACAQKVCGCAAATKLCVHTKTLCTHKAHFVYVFFVEQNLLPSLPAAFTSSALPNISINITSSPLASPSSPTIST